MKAFTWLWDGLRKVLGLILPFLSKVGDFRAASPVVPWILRLLLLIAIFILCWLIEPLLHLEDILLRAPPLLQAKPQLWFASLVILILLFGQVRSEEHTSELQSHLNLV